MYYIADAKSVVRREWLIEWFIQLSRNLYDVSEVTPISYSLCVEPNAFLEKQNNLFLFIREVLPRRSATDKLAATRQHTPGSSRTTP